MEKKLNIIYIGGNGHSGSTLLDIIIGNDKKCFSAGELINVTRKGILEEYCSCKEKVQNCEVWCDVLRRWDKKRSISREEYEKLRMKFDRNKAIVKTFIKRVFKKMTHLIEQNLHKLLASL